MDYEQISNLFSENNKAFQKAFHVEYNEMLALGALIATAKGKVLTKEKIKESYKLLTKNTGIFSSFRDTLRVPMTAEMACADEPQRYFEELNQVYKQLMTHFTIGSERRALAALMIYNNCPPELLYRMPDETYEMYQRLREQHPFLTGSEDMSYAALMAIKGGSPDAMVQDMEECYHLVKERFKLHFEPIHNVAQILSLNNKMSPKEKVELFNEYYDFLKKGKFRISVGDPLAIVAILVNIGIGKDEMLELCQKYNDFLKKQKGFGFLGVSTQSRRMMAIALAALEALGNETEAENAALTAVVNMIINFEITLMIIVISSAIARNSSSQS